MFFLRYLWTFQNTRTKILKWIDLKDYFTGLLLFL